MGHVLMLIIIPSKLCPHLKKNSSNLSPQHLVTAFEDAPTVGTLHDNLEHAIAQYGEVRTHG